MRQVKKLKGYLSKNKLKLFVTCDFSGYKCKAGVIYRCFFFWFILSEIFRLKKEYEFLIEIKRV